MHADLHAAARACHPRPQHCRKLEQFAQTRVLVATVLKPRRSTVANPDRDTVYTNDGTNRTVYTRENNSTGWFVGIIVALALLAIAYLVFSANSQPSTSSVDINNTPAVTAPAAPADTTTTPMAPADTTTTPMAPAANGTTVTPAAPATTAPADNGTSVAPSTSAPATTVSSAAPASDVTASSAAQ
jgi:hypothetical protein